MLLALLPLLCLLLLSVLQVRLPSAVARQVVNVSDGKERMVVGMMRKTPGSLVQQTALCSFSCSHSLRLSLHVVLALLH